MDKKQLTVATATLLFSSLGVATVSAEEITEIPVDNSVPTIVTSEATTSDEDVVQSPPAEQPVTETPVVEDGTTPVVPSETVPTLPTEQPITEVPTDPSVPTTPTETPVVPTEPAIPTDPTVPTTPSTGTEGGSSTETGTTEPVSPTAPSSTDTVVGVSPTKPADPIDAPTPAPIEAPEDTPVEGQVSQVTGQVVATVSEEAPIVTDTGYTIVSTDQGRVVIKNLDGTTSLVAPEQIGGTLNIDGTISVKNNSGSMTTLPSTGVEDTIFLVALGLFILALLGFSTIREEQDNWAIVI
ncbi:LPXTG cell wall anchor domain-containing protein [Streptococcus suis]|uniref:LPXTG cell wall anchor domain-containing protein n=1 Tax=Streptococcus suis TaxID=1307 RepID=UPI0038BBFE1F